MAAFGETTYSQKDYAAFRPEYPPILYNTILEYLDQSGSRNICVDLGCGHGLVARYLAKHFKQVIGVDPSEGMLATARSMTTNSEFPNLEIVPGTSEDLHFVDDGSVSLVTAGQAAHWFDFDKTWVELARKVHKGGALAFWSLRGAIPVNHPKAIPALIDHMRSKDADKLGGYWPAETSIISSKYRAIVPPEDDWEDIQRIDCIPTIKGLYSGQGFLVVSQEFSVGKYKEMMRTWSAFHHWQEAHPEARKRSTGGRGDIVDACFDEIAKAEPSFGDEDFVMDVEFETFLLLARRK